jgi:hypothetical protein
MSQERINQLFIDIPEFKEWIENTSLFHALRDDIGGTIRLHGEAGDIVGEIMRNCTSINKAEDLPIPMIQNFFENSPWARFKMNLIEILSKPLNNGQTTISTRTSSPEG